MKTLLGFIFMVFISVNAAYAHEHEHSTVKQDNAWENLGICPVMNKKATKEISTVYKGKTYYFCCQMCVAQFKKDPQKYISRIKEIKLEAYQFGFSPDTIKVKKGDIVKITASSRDVEHGIYIKDYKINVPVTKGETKIIEFVADKAGKFPIKCSKYCGEGHGDMRATLIVE